MSDTATVTKLAHNKYASDIREYLKAKADKKAYDALSRQAEEKVKNLRAVLFLAMDGADIAKCGNATISVKPGRTNAGALTMVDGRKLPLDTIKEIVFTASNGTLDVVNASDVKTWFGGSQGSDDLEVIVAGDGI